jgi:hypothetical protein
MKAQCGWAAIFVVLLASYRLGVAQHTTPAFSIVITSPKSVKSGASALLDVSVTNNTNHKIAFGLEDVTRAEFNFDFEVRDSRGNLVPESRYMKAVKLEDQGPGPRMVVTTRVAQPDLKPGQTLTTQADLSKLFQLEPGTYSVQLSRAEGAHSFVLPQSREDTDLQPAKSASPAESLRPLPPMGMVAKSNKITIAVIP